MDPAREPVDPPFESVDAGLEVTPGERSDVSADSSGWDRAASDASRQPSLEDQRVLAGVTVIRTP